MARSAHLFNLARLSRLVLTVAASAPILSLQLNANPSAPVAMSNPSSARIVEVPARIAGLAFNFVCPADFHALDLPDDVPDFEKPEVFFPLHIVMANYGAVLFTVGARPAYGDGTVEDWAGFIAREGKMEIISTGPGVVGGLPAIMVEATQPSEFGQMRVRMALIEDGTRMINLTIIAPAALWASVEPTLQLALSSFRLAEPRGATVALTQAAAAKQAEMAVATADEANPPADADKPVPSASEPTPIIELALAGDAASLDADQPMNARLRDQGVGLVPRVLELHPDQKYGLIGAGALEATCQIPFGWHVLDDGRRTLVFDAAGKIQISLNLRRTNGDTRALLESVLAETRRAQPEIDPLFTEFAPGLSGLVLRNYRDGDDVLVQAFVVRQVRDDGLAHVARVTAAADDMTQAMNLAEVIMRSLGVAPVVAVQ